MGALDHLTHKHFSETLGKFGIYFWLKMKNWFTVLIIEKKKHICK